MLDIAVVLESYLIPAEEGFIDKAKKAGKFIFDKILNMIKALIEKVQGLIDKFKSLIKNGKSISKSELMSQLQKAKSDNTELQKQAEDAISVRKQLEEELSQVKRGLIYSDKIALYMNLITKQTGVIASNIDSMRKAYTIKTKEELDEFIDDFDPASCLIRPDTIEELSEEIDDYLIPSKVYMTPNLKQNAQYCLEFSMKILNRLNKFVINANDVKIPEEIKDDLMTKLIYHAISGSVDSLNSAINQVKRVINIPSDQIVFIR